MAVIYPAIFTGNSDGSYTVTFPDLPGCITEGKTLSGALSMAQKALIQWIEYLRDEKEAIPSARDIKSIALDDTQFTTLIAAISSNSRAVRRTISIPQWMDAQASEAGLSLSKVLQDALSDRLGSPQQ